MPNESTFEGDQGVREGRKCLGNESIIIVVIDFERMGRIPKNGLDFSFSFFKVFCLFSVSCLLYALGLLMALVVLLDFDFWFNLFKYKAGFVH